MAKSYKVIGLPESRKELERWKREYSPAFAKKLLQTYKSIVLRLMADPSSCGEPKYTLHHGGVVHLVIQNPLAVTFALYEEQAVVIVFHLYVTAPEG